MIDKELYKSFNDRLPIFFRSWWLDVVCEGGEWRAEAHQTGGEYDSVFVYFLKCKFGLKYIVMPPLTQFLGDYSFIDRELGQYKPISNYYIDQLPRTAFTSICMSHTFQYWSPYKWRGFDETTRYSLVINDLTDLNAVYRNFEDSKQRNIRKAAAKFKVATGLSASDFYEFFEKNCGSKVEYSRQMFEKLHRECIINNSGTIFYAADENSAVCGVLFVVWDNQSMYALTYSFDNEARKSGVGDLLMFEAMKLASDKHLAFDFEGSMIENVEQSYRRFGSEPVGYHKISRANPIFRIINSVRQIY
ncbi:MAG: GNAT family N-acetyltransferase [Salinivirgaceae bacterium]|nr:GNAT family N-acetyltransferase [Salinivirgaceae bacterium]